MELLWDFLKIVGTALVTGFFMWLKDKNKNNAAGASNIADAALKWSIQDRQEVITLRQELRDFQLQLVDVEAELEKKHVEIQELKRQNIALKARIDELLKEKPIDPKNLYQ